MDAAVPMEKFIPGIASVRQQTGPVGVGHMLFSLEPDWMGVALLAMGPRHGGGRSPVAPVQRPKPTQGGLSPCRESILWLW